METTRRSFLKLVAAATAAATLKIVPEETPLDGDSLVGMVREIVGYDLSRDKYLLRHDIKAGALQLGVDQVLQSNDPASIERGRESSLATLRAEMERRGISASDLVPLNLPSGMHATYV
jgi:hypothetical protein